MSKTSSLL
jgi:hypothetical protein